MPHGPISCPPVTASDGVDALAGFAHSALKSAILTHADAIPEKTKRDLAPLIGKYVR